MLYVTNCAVLIKGDRVAPGVEVELDEAIARNYGTDLSPVGATVEVEVAPEPEPEIGEMTVAELKDKAASLGLLTSGTKADLIERITLHLEGGDVEEELEDNDQ